MGSVAHAVRNAFALLDFLPTINTLTAEEAKAACHHGLQK
jgi:hypothetical protein